MRGGVAYQLENPVVLEELQLKYDVNVVNPERRLRVYALYDIGVLLPKLHHLLLAGLVCLARLFGHHGGHFAEGTWNRISSPGCR